MQTNKDTYFDTTKKLWWEGRRMTYNISIIVSGVISFVLFAYIGWTYIQPFEPQFEITLFTIIFQAIGFGVMVGIANLFFGLGYWADKNFNSKNSDKFRLRLFYTGTAFSIFLPLTIPTLTLIRYLVCYA